MGVRPWLKVAIFVSILTALYAATQMTASSVGVAPQCQKRIVRMDQNRSCKRCKFYQLTPRKCSLTYGNTAPWDSCISFTSKGEQ